MRTAIFGLILALTGCAGAPQPGTAVVGRWGGTHVALTLSGSGGQLEYDCAAGTIGPIVPADDGQFVSVGTHTPAAGGPEIAGQPRPTYAIRYNGTVRGDRMTLRGRVENGVLLGPFALRRGSEPTIFRCL